MPNWCSTEYCFYGDDEAVKKLSKDIKRVTSKNYMENGFGKEWLGNVVLGFGFPYKGNGFSFRGWIADIDEGEDRLYVRTETAWAPMPEMWDAIIKRHFADEDGDSLISYVFISEEPGMGLYINTDINGTYFPDRYLLEIGEIPEHEEYESYYMTSEQEVIDTVNEIFKLDNENFDEAKTFLYTKQDQIYKTNY